LRELQLQSQNPDFWNNPKEIEKLNKEKRFLEKAVEEWENIHTRAGDAQVLLEMAVEEGDEASFLEVREETKKLEGLYQGLELKRILNEEMDGNGAYLSINSGAGGTEACDWAGMLYRMYLRYAQDKGFKTQIMEMTEGDEAGIKSVTIHVDGPYAYGYLKAENGVHRLVRISPFDSNARRHTSFASVFSFPEVDDDIEIEIKTEDLRIDTYRASGAGGQHVNRTDSAVRITHNPTGIVVQCQSERSQHSNRDRAMKMLKAALYKKEMEERKAKEAEVHSQKKDIEWGSQIRSYVMHPYQMVKDHRTNFETSKVKDVMDGDIGNFIESFLKERKKGK